MLLLQDKWEGCLGASDTYDLHRKIFHLYSPASHFSAGLLTFSTYESLQPQKTILSKAIQKLQLNQP
jgi:hypothetical protein